jgi:alkylresorcinol/alkylpyrone synthase
MLHPVSLLSLATAVPPHVLEQREVASRMLAAFGGCFERNPQLSDIFVNAGIERRYSVRPIEWIEQPHDWGERGAAYLDGAGELFVAAAASALERAGLRGRDIDVIVSVTSSGIATPSLDARVGPALGLRPDVSRVPVFGLGCAGGATGLAIAARLARAHPGHKVLLVAVELNTLAFRRDRRAKANIIASALFGDGAAAAVLETGSQPGSLARIGASAEHTWPDTLDVDPLGLGVVLSRAVPRFIEQRLGAPAAAFVSRAGCDPRGRFLCHPGGAKVVAAIETALRLRSGTLAHERAVLRDYGNMSSPSVLFVLDRALADGLRGPAVITALGPGFTASFLSLEAGHA